MKRIYAPFDEAQIESINGYQACSRSEPLTCALLHDKKSVLLTVSKEGMKCPSCSFTQNWVHDFMTDNSWKEVLPSEEELRQIANIPMILQRRPRCTIDGIIYPIPYVTVVNNGKPEFSQLDPTAWEDCVVGELCAQCGEPLEGDIWFMGGPITMKNAIFTDPPSHKVCAQYAARICPYLAGMKIETPSQGAHPFVHVKTDFERPEVYYARQAEAFDLIRTNETPSRLYIKAVWSPGSNPIELKQFAQENDSRQQFRTGACPYHPKGRGTHLGSGP